MMKSTPKPDAEEYARNMLWQICGLRAQVSIMMQMMTRQLTPDVRKANEIFSDWMKDAAKLQAKHYTQQATAAKLEKTE